MHLQNIKARNLKTRAVALLTGGAIAASAVFHPVPAQADNSKNEKVYKGGAVALGVLGAYFILKGKTVPGAIAGAGAYYAYKKGKDANNDRYSDNNYSDNRYANNGNNNNSSNNSNQDRYPDGSWSTPSSNRSANNRDTDNRNSNERYSDYGTTGITSSNNANNSDSTIVLK